MESQSIVTEEINMARKRKLDASDVSERTFCDVKIALNKGRAQTYIEVDFPELPTFTKQEIDALCKMAPKCQSISQGLKKKNDYSRKFFFFEGCFKSKHQRALKDTEIEKKLRDISLSVHAWSDKTRTHRVSKMTVIISSPGGDEQEFHTDFKVDIDIDLEAVKEIPYLLIIPLQAGTIR